MIGWPGGGGIGREQAKARRGGGRRAAAVLGMLAVPLAGAGGKKNPATAKTTDAPKKTN